MNWKNLTNTNQLVDLNKSSAQKSVLIFKFSTRCSISRAVLDRLERNWDDSETGDVELYFLDLIAHRQVSNAIEEQYGVIHESPQVIIIENGRAAHHWSHFDINYNEIAGKLRKGSKVTS